MVDLLHYTIDELSKAISKWTDMSQLKAEEYYKRGKKLGLNFTSTPFTFFREYILNRNFRNGYEGYHGQF
jgi:hypothetical protein